MSTDYARATTAIRGFFPLGEPITATQGGWIALRVGTAVKTSPETETETEKGQQLFLDEVKKLDGVLGVETFGGGTIGERSICVRVRRSDQQTEYAVYDLKGRVYQQYPDAYLRVEIWLEDSAEDTIAPAADTVPNAAAA